MTPQERLYAEEIPTGTFGDARPAHSRSQRLPRPWTREEQAAHYRELAEALGIPHLSAITAA
ncbi:hypothetical protein ACFUJR_00925 [Streptomyces sp. NPDC057271]|uniref:hypothetical protein n=1 Tax=unclassified Streptomyces TaxID=2593676 RepID=UPI00363E90CC